MNLVLLELVGVIILKFLILLLFVAFSLPLYAADPERVVNIKTLHPMGSSRPHCPSCQGFTRVYIKESDVSWGNTTCRKDAADLSKEDTHLMSVLLIAFSTGRPVKIEVTDILRPVSNDQVCQITAIWLDQ